MSNDPHIDTLNLALEILAALIIPERFGAIYAAFREDNDHDDIKALFDGLPSVIGNSHDLVFFENRGRALEHCIDKIRSATLVKNMVLRYGDTATYAPVNLYYPKWFEAKKERLSNSGCELTEIVSKYFGPEDPQRRDSETYMATKQAYQFKKIDDKKMPLLQVTVFYYDGGSSKEVVFGWEFPGRRHGGVFASRNPALITILEKYFDESYACLPDTMCWADEEADQIKLSDRISSDVGRGTSVD